MLVIGKKYQFNKYDFKKIKQNIDFIDEYNNLKEIINHKNYNLIILNINKSDYSQFTKDIRQSLKKDTQIISIESFLEEYLHKIYISEEEAGDVFLENIKPFNKQQYFIKRTIDYLAAIILFVISFPVILYSIYRIKKESPDGPILFKQNRIGKNNKSFICYKLRSMKTNIDFVNHYEQENDPRVFKWGKFMRKTRIDELPQLWNVIKGDLHLIGPRAEWDELVKKYEKKIPYYHNRHINAPGITGWAQVNYPYGVNSKDSYQKLMYDLYYYKHWSIWFEIKIIFHTIKVIVKKID